MFSEEIERKHWLEIGSWFYSNNVKTQLKTLDLHVGSLGKCAES